MLIYSVCAKILYLHQLHPVRCVTATVRISIYFNQRTPCGVQPASQTDHQRTRYNFNQRTPCGVQPRSRTGFRDGRPPFQSTHPVRGATDVAQMKKVSQYFNLTHPVRGATRTDEPHIYKPVYFNQRTPCGVQQQNYTIQVCLGST